MSLISIDDYRAIRHPVPYIVHLRTPRGSLLYYGARHDYDPASLQAADIQRRWAEMRPGLALHEGGPRPPKRTLPDAVRSHGEAGLVHALADRDGVPLRSLEPHPADEVRHLVDSYTAEQVKLYYVLRQVPQIAQRPQSGPLEDEVSGFLGHLSRRLGLPGSPQDVAQLDESCARHLPPGADWRRARSAWCYPTTRDPALYTAALSRALTRYRDEHMVGLLRAELRAGQRILAVVGASHVVMQEPAIRAAVSGA